MVGAGSASAGAPPGRRRRHPVHGVLQFRDVHHVLDALGELGSHKLHPLAELTGEEVSLAFSRISQGARIARVGVEGHGRQWNDRQQEERDDETKSKAHGTEQLDGAAGPEGHDHRGVIARPELPF
jgi:hypothetical protein